MGFLDWLFGRGKAKPSEFDATIDRLLAIPFEAQDKLKVQIDAMRAEVKRGDAKAAARKVAALVARYKTLRKGGTDANNMLNVRKVYLGLVALEDEFPAAHQACREIEKFIQG